VVIPELPSYTMCPSIVHSSTWNISQNWT